MIFPSFFSLTSAADGFSIPLSNLLTPVGRPSSPRHQQQAHRGRNPACASDAASTGMTGSAAPPSASSGWRNA